MTNSPEQRARREIDANLELAGWLVQDRAEMDPTSGPGVAVREFPMKTGFGSADYVLYVDFDVVGAIEAKAKGTLFSVGAQATKYAAGLPENLPAPWCESARGFDADWRVRLLILNDSQGSKLDADSHCSAIRGFSSA